MQIDDKIGASETASSARNRRSAASPCHPDFAGKLRFRFASSIGEVRRPARLAGQVQAGHDDQAAADLRWLQRTREVRHEQLALVFVAVVAAETAAPVGPLPFLITTIGRPMKP